MDDDDQLDDIDSASGQNKNSYFKKYRTQNIRQKKTQKQLTSKVHPQRPHSASNLIRSSSNFIPNGQTSSQDKNLTRSNTNINTESATRRQLNSDIMKPKTNLSIYKDKTSLSKQSLFENDADEAPIRLCSDSDDLASESSKVSSKASHPTLRSASSVINGSTRSGSSLGMKTTNSSSTSAFSTNSLPRSRTPNGSYMNSEFMGSSTHSYRSATLSSINKSAHSSNENIHISNSSTINGITQYSTASTQYHPISTNIGKSSTLPHKPDGKKKTVFY